MKWRRLPKRISAPCSHLPKAYPDNKIINTKKCNFSHENTKNISFNKADNSVSLSPKEGIISDLWSNINKQTHIHFSSSSCSTPSANRENPEKLSLV